MPKRKSAFSLRTVSASVHIHTINHAGPIYQGSREDAEAFVENLKQRFGIKVSISKRTPVNYGIKKVTHGYFLKFGKRQGSCFFVHLPDVELFSELKKTLRNAPLLNIDSIKCIAQRGDCESRSRWRPPAHSYEK